VTGSLITAGLAVASFGLVVLMILIRYGRDENWRLRVAEGRRLDKSLSPAVRHGKLTEAEWNERFARRQRTMVQKVLIPFVILWIGGGLTMLLLGL